ncbi:condensin complex subunit 3 [Tribolium castaneum]|uniref:Condensin complex subunit 3-like Protein n=1 Tax=Tribolium castaneum TaxID=7070 RepID=D6WQG2_TRICA|nr:PREDICTED: condensin complex subunit 3 [Tribolium castaneum]EFA06967.1 Condensin complex subunit 3-like Protein [Tribolium castaneum]|eukprot:XP_008195810.1 PREDICTED: condensin complex subunit 3 [Tribolium castaneum]
MEIEAVKVDDVLEIFNTIQQSSGAHLHYATILKNALSNENDSELFSTFCKCVEKAFCGSCKEDIYNGRIFSFVLVLAATFHPKKDDVIHPVLRKIIQHLIALSYLDNEPLRFWSCKLINGIMKNVDEIDDELFEEFKNAMIERLKDPKVAIRGQAILAVHRLQDPSDKNDPITRQLCTYINSDSNGKLRQVCVEKVAINKHVLTLVLERLRDINLDVRLAAFEKIRLLIKYLNLSQRHYILQCGFNDPSQKVHDFVSTDLMKSWLEFCNNDYVRLINTIRLDASEDDIEKTTIYAEQMLRALFKNAPVNDITSCLLSQYLNEQKLIEYEKLNWDIILYYRIVVQFLRQSPEFEETLNSILPELVLFCKYIRGYIEFIKTKQDLDELEYHFTLKQFFIITETYDVSDSASRQCLNSLVHDALKKEVLPTSVEETIVRNLEKTFPDTNTRLVFVCEIISDIFYGEDEMSFEEFKRQEMEKSHTISQLKSDIALLSEQEKYCASVEKNYSEAARLRAEIDEKQAFLENVQKVQEKPEVEKKTDVGTMLKCLTITESLLLSPKVQYTPTIATLTTEHINPAMLHEDKVVQAKALKCYALCCLIDRKCAIHGIHLFSSFIITSVLAKDSEILKLSLQAVTDILILYGTSFVEEKGEENGESQPTNTCFIGGTSLTALIEAMTNYMQDEDPGIEETATRCICILLLRNRLTSSSVLSALIIKWANPATTNEGVKQIIGHTLQSLTALPNCEYFADAVLSTIRTIVYAPGKSPLCDIDTDNITKFMVTLCKMSSQGTKILADLALKMCNQMREKPKLKINPYFAKALTMMDLSQSERLNSILFICNELQEVVDKQSSKNIKKFITNASKNVKLASISEE